MIEINELSNKIYEEQQNELGNLIKQRLKELYEISKKKGINDFGWKYGIPFMNDYENEYDFVCAFDEYCNTEVLLMMRCNCLSWEYAAHRFKFDERGNLVITAYYDYEKEEYVEDCEVDFNYRDRAHIFNMGSVIDMIEQELGVE